MDVLRSLLFHLVFINLVLISDIIFFLHLTGNIHIVCDDYERLGHFRKECITIEPLFDFSQIHTMATVGFHRFPVHAVAANNPNVFNVFPVVRGIKLQQSFLEAAAHKHIRWECVIGGVAR
uniref:Uncharacterized protein n=1 Tax=Anopheles dirus TaxID=7168 RepID=A0A182N8W5_9DIPT